jgi:hypothetical protein
MKASVPEVRDFALPTGMHIAEHAVQMARLLV